MCVLINFECVVYAPTLYTLTINRRKDPFPTLEVVKISRLLLDAVCVGLKLTAKNTASLASIEKPNKISQTVVQVHHLNGT